jgi:hypothetical protein
VQLPHCLRAIPTPNNGVDDMNSQAEPDKKSDALRIAYQEVCNSYHRIDDFRAKLLGLLPLASAGGVFLLLRNEKGQAEAGLANRHLLVAGVIGAIVSVALFFYELRGVQRCIRLYEVGKKLEEDMGIQGQFVRWTHSVGRTINEPIAASIIYSIVTAGWSYVALVRWWPNLAVCMGIIIFVLGLLCGSSFYVHVRPKNNLQSSPISESSTLEIQRVAETKHQL